MYQDDIIKINLDNEEIVKIWWRVMISNATHNNNNPPVRPPLDRLLNRYIDLSFIYLVALSPDLE